MRTLAYSVKFLLFCFRGDIFECGRAWRDVFFKNQDRTFAARVCYITAGIEVVLSVLLCHSDTLSFLMVFDCPRTCPRKQVETTARCFASLTLPVCLAVCSQLHRHRREAHTPLSPLPCTRQNILYQNLRGLCRYLSSRGCCRRAGCVPYTFCLSVRNDRQQDRQPPSTCYKVRAHLDLKALLKVV